MNNEFPHIRVFEWDITELASPVGNRTSPGGTFAFKQIVASGCSTSDPNFPSSTSGIINFAGTKFDLTNGAPDHLASIPSVITFNLAASGTAISDIKLYLVNDSVFQASADEGLDRGFMQFAPSGSSWLPNTSMPSGAFPKLTTIIPSQANVFRQDGTAGLVAQDDQNSSEFVYLNVVIPLGTPLGSYGVCGSGFLRLGIQFNYWCNDFLLQF